MHTTEIVNSTKNNVPIKKIEKCIENAWRMVRNDIGDRIWWDEKELVMSFYFHLRPMIDELNRDLGKTQLCVIPEYAPKASSYAKQYDKKYPLLKKGEKELKRTKKVDLCIVAFDSDDFEAKKKDSAMTHWYIKHAPVVLMEFKLLAKKWLLKAMEKDLQKLAKIEGMYRGVERMYFCYLSTEKILEEECQLIGHEAKAGNLRICYGTWDGKDWNVEEPRFLEVKSDEKRVLRC